MRLSALSLAGSLLLTLTSLPAMAWGGLGHRVIVEIAQRHLTEEARRNIAAYMPYDMKKDALWMDAHRKDKDIAFTTAYHTYNIDPVSGKYEASYRYWKGDCVRALYVSDYILRNRKELSDSATLMNIRMVIHWVGDLHCPTHSYLEAKDGQKWPCAIGDRKFASFHSVYDKIPELLYPGMKAEQVADMIDDAKPRQIKKIASGEILDWVEEIGALNSLIYEINPVPSDKSSVQLLDPETVEKSRELCNVEMRNAGYRLARLLNEYFGN